MSGPKLILWALLIFSIPASGFAEDSTIVVVVNSGNSTEHMTRSQVIDLFMGKYVAFPNGAKAIPLDLIDANTTKQQFYQSLVGLSLGRVNSYWSRIRFTGRARPSLKQNNEDEVVRYVGGSMAAIGYVRRAKLNDKIKVVYEVDD